MQKPENVPVTFAKNDVEIIARETLYSGFFSMDLYRFRHRLFNGEMSGEIRREIFERGHAAVLLPFDPVRDEVVLVEQIRIAAYDVSESPWLLEMVAGMIEEGETVEDVARREALEEAADLAAVDALDAEVAAAERALLADVERRLDTEDDAAAAAADVRALMFVNRFRQDIERRLDALDPTR